MSNKATYEELIQRIHVLESEAAKREEAAMIQQLQHDLIMNLRGKVRLPDCLETILSTIFQVKGFDSGAIYLFDDNTNHLKMVAHKGLPEWFVKKTIEYEPDDTRVQLLIEGKPVYLATHQFHPAIALDLESDQILSMATIPLHSNEKVIGCLNLASHTCQSITEKNKKIVESIADTHIGLLISQIIGEEKLRENEEKFSKAFHSNASIMALSTLEEGRFIDVNAEFLKVLGSYPASTSHPLAQASDGATI